MQLQRFKQELILATRQVTDRNIIRIFDIGEKPGTEQKFITMEYIEASEPPSNAEASSGKLEVAEADRASWNRRPAALAAAHQRRNHPSRSEAGQ